MPARASRLVLVVAGMLCLGGTVAAQETAAQAWLHVQMTGDGSENVNLNLPLSVAEPLLALAPDRILPDGQLDLAEQGLPVKVSAMRDTWRALMDVGDTEFVTVEGDNETVRVARNGDQIEVRIEDRGGASDETVEVQLPIAVVDALLSGDGDTLNVRAAIARLSELRGDIVRVTEDQRQIRVWIDEAAP